MGEVALEAEANVSTSKWDEDIGLELKECYLCCYQHSDCCPSTCRRIACSDWSFATRVIQFPGATNRDQHYDFKFFFRIFCSFHTFTMEKRSKEGHTFLMRNVIEGIQERPLQDLQGPH